MLLCCCKWTKHRPPISLSTGHNRSKLNSSGATCMKPNHMRCVQRTCGYSRRHPRKKPCPHIREWDTHGTFVSTPTRGVLGVLDAVSQQNTSVQAPHSPTAHKRCGASPVSCVPCCCTRKFSRGAYTRTTIPGQGGAQHGATRTLEHLLH